MTDEERTKENIEATPGTVVETSRTVETTLGPEVETTTVERKDETTTKVERE